MLFDARLHVQCQGVQHIHTCIAKLNIHNGEVYRIENLCGEQRRRVIAAQRATSKGLEEKKGLDLIYVYLIRIRFFFYPCCWCCAYAISYICAMLQQQKGSKQFVVKQNKKLHKHWELHHDWTVPYSKLIKIICFLLYCHLLYAARTKPVYFFMYSEACDVHICFFIQRLHWRHPWNASNALCNFTADKLTININGRFNKYN